MLACASCIVGFVCRETWPCDPLVNCRLLCVFGANSLLGIARYRERCKEVVSILWVQSDTICLVYYTIPVQVWFFYGHASS